MEVRTLYSLLMATVFTGVTSLQSNIPREQYVFGPEFNLHSLLLYLWAERLALTTIDVTLTIVNCIYTWA